MDNKTLTDKTKPSSQPTDAQERRYYDQILPEKEWPIIHISRNRKDFVEQVINEAYKNILAITGEKFLKEELESTVYKEKLRVKQNPWLVDPDDDVSFWRKTQKALLATATEKAAREREICKDLLRGIITRYAEEIAGNFKESHYQLARKLVTFGFRRLLNTSRVKGIRSLWAGDMELQDKIHVVGETEQLRELAKRGTIVMVPTHFSNLDSMLIGWVIQHLGLPPFIYGAGLNLFNIKIFAYFMNSLGAYKVDRRKKNMIYLETLKAYSTLAMMKGCHSLFFPGGTRSRSGNIEDKLKLGLLGTAMEAQRKLFFHQQGDRKIFIVPVVINYHFVLEAPGLIHDYLERQGQERYYVERDEYSTSFKIFKFLLKFFTKGSDISVSIGRGMDLWGNYVNNQGESLGKTGYKLETADYFTLMSEFKYDQQRQEQYTRLLAERVVEEFHKHNRVFSSHLVAYVAFQMIKKKNRKLDLYNLLRLPEEDQILDYEEFKNQVKKLRAIIFKLKEEKKVNIAKHLKLDLEEVIEHGLSNVGMYHSKRPLIKNTEGNIMSQDLKLLYYYHNRLEGYGLEKYFI